MLERLWHVGHLYDWGACMACVGHLDDSEVAGYGLQDPGVLSYVSGWYFLLPQPVGFEAFGLA